VKTQTETILEHLEKYDGISPLEALQLYGIFRLAPRVNELRNAGFPITSKLVKGANGKHFARYTLDKTAGV